jgi:ABC-2 type transport system ATP-binding protein
MTPNSVNQWAMDLTDVHKTYKGRVHALRGVSMRVARGEIFGLLGPNGAGKSTLVKILMTVIRSSNCHGSVLGGPIGHKPTLARIGYLPEHHRFPEYLTGRQVIDYFGALCGTPRRQRRARSAELLELVGMKDWANHKVRGYSKGMRQRIGIAQALVNDPDLVLLDEPTDGVDPVGRREIRSVLTHIKDAGKTVFLNSHLLSELEMVCDRVAIMVQGKVVSQGTINELTADQQRYEIELEDVDALDPEQVVRRALPGTLEESGSTVSAFATPPQSQVGGSSGLAGNQSGNDARTIPNMARRVGLRGTLASGLAFELDQRTIRLRTTQASDVQPVIDQLRAQGVVIRSFRPVRPSLEDLFMQAVVDPNTGAAKGVGAAKEDRR